MKSLILASFTFLLISSTFAMSIKVIGNKKTSSEKVMALARIEEATSFNKKELSQMEQRLLRSGLFVDAKVSKSKDEIIIEVEDRWTLIPILKFASGGGVTQTTIGTYEANLFGTVRETGAQYERLGGTNSGVMWFKDPLAINNKTGIDLQLWKTNRLRTKYNQKMSTPKVDNGFLHVREKVYLGINRIINDNFRLGIKYQYHKDKFSTKLVPTEAKSFTNAINLPPDTKFHFIGAHTELGQLKQRRHLQDGNVVNANFDYGMSSTDDIPSFFQANLSWKYFKSVKNYTFAQRILMGMTNTESLQHWNYLGGLDRIRGFADNRFAGRYYWLSNSEFRYSLVDRPKWVLQASTFLDLVSTTEFFKGLGNLTASSAGIGMRVILPKIYRFVFRVDYAKPLKRDDDNAVSFGVQQFF